MPNKIFFAPNGNVCIQEFGNADDSTQLTSEWEGAAALTQVRVSGGNLLLNRYGGLDTKAFAVADFVGCLTNEYITIPAIIPDDPAPLLGIESYLLSFFSGRVSFAFRTPETGAISTDVDIALPFGQSATACTVSLFSRKDGANAVSAMPLLVAGGLVLAEFSADAASIMTGVLPVPSSASIRFVQKTAFSNGVGAVVTVTLS